MACYFHLDQGNLTRDILHVLHVLVQLNQAQQKKTPKYSIANSFVIGSFPKEIKIRDKAGYQVKRVINEEELTDLLKAMLAPVRPYGYVFAYSGGAQKSLQGNYQFFEMDHNRLGGVMNQLVQAGIGEHIYCVLCGRMTPEQKQIVRKRSKVNTGLFIDILTWFITESGHPAFSNVSIPEECPQPIYVEDEETKNNTDDPIDPDLEKTFEGGTFSFSSAQDPSESSSIYGSREKFALALLNHTAPTLLAIGGTYANQVELKVEHLLPFAFPFGIGGPKMKQRTKYHSKNVANTTCNTHYLNSWKETPYW